MEYDYLIKTIIIGDTNVGKSNILTKFADDEFKSDFSSTIGVDYKTVRVDYLNQTVKLLIWDTAGQERFKSITKTFYKGSQVVIVCFDLTNRGTFDNVDLWIEDIYNEHFANPIIVLAGTKADLKTTRTVSKEEAVKKSTQLKLHGYFETSSKTSIGIEEMFFSIIKLYCSFENIKEMKKIKQIKQSKNNFFKSFCNIC